MLRRNDFLMKKARILALNKDYSATHGVQDDFILAALQEAVDVLNNYLVNQRVEPFSAFYDFPAVSGADSYPVPDNAYMNTLVYEVWYSGDGSEVGFGDYPLDPVVRRDMGSRGYPETVNLDNGRIYPIPAPDSGTFRIKYDKRIATPDLQRGLVENITIVNGVITALQIDPDTVADRFFFEDDEFITIVNSLGQIQASGIQFAAYDATNGTFLLTPYSLTVQNGSGAQPGDWVCIGKCATTHLDLPDFTEKYLINYMVERIMLGDSSTDQTELSPALNKMLESIAETYAQSPGGIYGIPETRRY